MFGKKQPKPNCTPEEEILDITDLNPNIPGDVTLNLQTSKQPSSNIINLNQNIPDNVTLNTEILKQLTPNCIQGMGILDIIDLDLNQNNPDDMKLNLEISKQLQNNELEKLNTELLDQKNSKEITMPLNSPKRQRKQVALKKTYFYWT